MKIYVITKGCYSEYHICAVATDREKAEKLAKIYTDRWGDADVEEFDTDDEVDLLEGRVPFEIPFTSMGGILMREIRADIECRESFEPEIIDTPECRYTTWDRKEIVYPARLTVKLFAPDEATAIKSAIDKRAAYLAEKEQLL